MTGPNLYGMDRTALGAIVEGFGAPRFHGGQIFRWLYARGRLDPALWTDLPRSLRERLAAGATVAPGAISRRAEASDGTVKYAIDLPGGGAVETVAMVQAGRTTLCLSSQVGCALGCDFCLTAKMGFVRHLAPGEIVGQAALVLADRGEDAPSNVVFMGMGEPLHNYDGVLAAIRILTDEDGLALSRRRITVSTSGLVPAIERLAAEPAKPRLAVSLNATTDAVRDRIMPINRTYPLDRLVEACRLYARASAERVTFEFVLLLGVNDSDEDAARLARIAARLPAKVNLIPFNPVPGWLDYRSPPRERVIAFRDDLLARGIRAGIRWSRGAEARAACGQLALLPETPVSGGGP